MLKFNPSESSNTLGLWTHVHFLGIEFIYQIVPWRQVLMGKGQREVTCKGKEPRNDAYRTKIQTWSVANFYPGLVVPRKSFSRELTFKRAFVCRVGVSWSQPLCLRDPVLIFAVKPLNGTWLLHNGGLILLPHKPAVGTSICVYEISLCAEKRAENLINKLM